MSEIENPPAFPRTGEGFGNPKYDAPGMTLRDWFAGQALAGLTMRDIPPSFGDDLYRFRAAQAVSAYGIADAMLDARALLTPSVQGEG